MSLSIVICTYNRARYLDKALQSLVSELNVIEYEIVIVDNNCTDNSKEIAEKHIKSGLIIHYVVEKNQGLSYARNRGYKEAKYPYVAYLDDDALACSGWIKAIDNQIKNNGNSNFIAGGKIEVVWEQPRPDWLRDDLLNWLGKLDLGEARKLNFPEEHINGGNMVINKSLLIEIEGFNTSLGIQGKKMFTNEEIELQERAIGQNASIYYDPDMKILHHARLNVTPDWFFKRSYNHGISVARTMKNHQNSLKSFSTLIKTWKSILKLKLKKALHRVDGITYTSEMVAHHYLLGYSREMIKLSLR